MSRKSKLVRNPYREVGKADEHNLYMEQELTTGGENYILNVPQFKAIDYYGRCKERNEELYKKISDYAKEEGLLVNKSNMPIDISAEKYIELIKRAKIELGQGWGINEKIWITNKVNPTLVPYVNVRPAKGSGFSKPREKKEKSGKKEEKAKTIEELKPGEEMEIDPSEITFGRMLPPVTQYVERKKEPTMTRKEFTERIKEEKERHYKEFLDSYYKYGVDNLGTSNSAVASSKPYGEAAEAYYYVFKDKDPVAWNKIVNKDPELEPLLKKHNKLIKNPKEYFEQFYYQESEREPSEGFLSSEGEKESQYKDDSSEYAYDSDNWHGYAEGNPYSDLEEEEGEEDMEEIIQKMPALSLSPAPAPAPAPAPSSKQTKRELFRERMLKKKKGKEVSAPPPAPATAKTGSMAGDEFKIRRDLYEKEKPLNANPALKEAGWELVLDKSKLEHYYYNPNTGEERKDPPTPPSGGKKTRKRGKRTKKSKMKKTKKTENTKKKKKPKKKNHTRKK